MFGSVARSNLLGAINVANYVDSIKVGPLLSRGGGRAMFATRDIDAGKLLVRHSRVCDAMADT